MMIIRNVVDMVLATSVALFISGLMTRAAAQPDGRGNDPCATGLAPFDASKDPGVMLVKNQSDMAPPGGTNELETADIGLVFYDANQGLRSLADANLAGNAEIRELLGVTGINPGGTMTYAVALNWVNALNNFDHGRGLLGHHDWQLPVTPKFDSTNCSSNDNGTFGVLCSGSALGNPTCEGSSHSERIRSSNSG